MSGYHFGESGVVTTNKFIQGVQRKLGKVEMMYWIYIMGGGFVHQGKG